MDRQTDRRPVLMEDHVQRKQMMMMLNKMKV